MKQFKICLILKKTWNFKNSMRDKLASTDGFEFNDYEIIEMNADTVIIDDVEYRF